MNDLSIDPFWWLGLLIVAVLVLRLLGGRRRHSRAVRLSAVAREARMNYSPVDRFDLARRLQQSPRWTGGLTVRDVIYGASGTERRFIATVERRASADDRPRRLVVACVESLDAGGLREAAEAVTLGMGRSRADVYRDALLALGLLTNPPAADGDVQSGTA